MTHENEEKGAREIYHWLGTIENKSPTVDNQYITKAFVSIIKSENSVDYQ